MYNVEQIKQALSNTKFGQSIGLLQPSYINMSKCALHRKLMDTELKDIHENQKTDFS